MDTGRNPERLRRLADASAARRGFDRGAARRALDLGFAATLINQIDPCEDPADGAYQEPRLRMGIVSDIRA